MEGYVAYQFLQAARGGNIQKLRLCIRQGVKVDSKDDQSIVSGYTQTIKVH